MAWCIGRAGRASDAWLNKREWRVELVKQVHQLAHFVNTSRDSNHVRFQCPSNSLASEHQAFERRTR